MPILTGFAVYLFMLVRFRLPGGRRTNVRVRIMFQALLPSVLLVFAASLFAQPDRLFGGFLASLIAVLVFAFWNHQMWWIRPLQGAARCCGTLAATALVWAIVVGPVWLLHTDVATGSALAPGLVVLPFAWINDRLMGPGPEFDKEKRWTPLRSLWVVAVIALVYGLQLLDVLPVWALS